MFETVKNEAIEAKSAITSLTPETSSEQKSQIERSFIEKTKAREEAIAKAEKANDVTQTEALTKSKADFVEFQKDYTTEMTALLEEAKKQSAEVIDQKKNELADLWSEININKNIDLSTLSGKSRTELWQTPWYISKIQEMILTIWAKHTNISDNKLKDGIFWPAVKAGVKTIQNHLNRTYQTTLAIDGIPGENTLAALLSPVSETDKISRLDKMLSEKPTFTKIFEIERSSAAPKKTEAQKQAREKTEAIKTPLDIDWANKEIPEKILNDNIAKLKKLYPKSLKDKDEAFIKAWAIALIEHWDKHTYFTYNKVRYWFEGTKYIPASEKWKSEKAQEKKKEQPKINVSENVGEKSRIDNNILEVAHTDIQYNLINYMKNHPITFEWTNARHYKKYYEENITSIKKPKINITSINRDKQVIRINILDNYMGKYYIDIKPANYIKKGDYSTNFTTINNSIQEDIIKKVDAKLAAEQDKKLGTEYRKAQEYLEDKYFKIDYLYSKEEQVPLVKAFFRDFSDGIVFDSGNSKFLKSSKQIEVELDNDGWNKYGTGKISLEDKFNTDGTINKLKMKESIRAMIDRKIQRVYPSYKPEQKSATTKTENKNQYGK